jgi:hypothetical protein
MNISYINCGDIKVAVVDCDNIIITDVESVMDFISDICFANQAEAIIIPKLCVSEEFFNLSNKIAGEILQKLTNYKIRLAIIGDFSSYKSKALQDFIRESNKSGKFLFVSDISQVLKIWEK